MRGLLASTFLLLHAPDEASALTRPVLTKGVNTEANLVRCDTLIPELHPTTRSRSVGTDDLLRLRDFGGIDASEADPGGFAVAPDGRRSEEHTSELQSLMRNSYAVVCLTQKKCQ